MTAQSSSPKSSKGMHHTHSSKSAGHAQRSVSPHVSCAQKAVRIKELEALVAERTDAAQRLQAEFENYQKRVAKEKQVIGEQEKARTLAGFLGFWESLAKAVAHAKNSEKKGLMALQKQFETQMNKEGVRPMQTVGAVFDPQLHDSVMVANAPDKPDNTVLEELSKGFWFNDRVLSHAKVKINKISQTKKEP